MTELKRGVQCAQANELLLGDGAGGFTRETSGAAVERTDNSYGGVVFDANGDGVKEAFIGASDGFINYFRNKLFWIATICIASVWNNKSNKNKEKNNEKFLFHTILFF